MLLPCWLRTSARIRYVAMAALAINHLFCPSFGLARQEDEPKEEDHEYGDTGFIRGSLWFGDMFSPQFESHQRGNETEVTWTPAESGPEADSKLTQATTHALTRGAVIYPTNISIPLHSLEANQAYGAPKPFLRLPGSFPDAQHESRGALVQGPRGSSSKRPSAQPELGNLRRKGKERVASSNTATLRQATSQEPINGPSPSQLESNIRSLTFYSPSRLYSAYPAESLADRQKEPLFLLGNFPLQSRESKELQLQPSIVYMPRMIPYYPPLSPSQPLLPGTNPPNRAPASFYSPPMLQQTTVLPHTTVVSSELTSSPPLLPSTQKPQSPLLTSNTLPQYSPFSYQHTQTPPALPSAYSPSRSEKTSRQPSTPRLTALVAKPITKQRTSPPGSQHFRLAGPTDKIKVSVDKTTTVSPTVTTTTVFRLPVQPSTSLSDNKFIPGRLSFSTHSPAFWTTNSASPMTAFTETLSSFTTTAAPAASEISSTLTPPPMTNTPRWLDSTTSPGYTRPPRPPPQPPAYHPQVLPPSYQPQPEPVEIPSPSSYPSPLNPGSVFRPISSKTWQKLITPQWFSPLPPGITPVPNRVKGNARIICGEREASFAITTIQPFTGQIFTRDKNKVPSCVYNFNHAWMPNVSFNYVECNIDGKGLSMTQPIVDGNNRDRQFQAHLQIIVVFQNHNETTSSVPYSILCGQQQGDSDKQLTRQSIGETLEELRLVSTIVEQKAPVPEARMQIFIEEDRYKGNNGLEITEVNIGQPLLLEFGLLPASSAYGFHVRNCFVKDAISGAQHQIIDEKGCSIDTSIFGHPHYDTDLDVATIRVLALKPPDNIQLSVRCNLYMCTDIPDNAAGSNGSSTTSCSETPVPPYCPVVITHPEPNSIFYTADFGESLRRLSRRGATMLVFPELSPIGKHSSKLMTRAASEHMMVTATRSAATTFSTQTVHADLCFVHNSTGITSQHEAVKYCNSSEYGEQRQQHRQAIIRGRDARIRSGKLCAPTSLLAFLTGLCSSLLIGSILGNVATVCLWRNTDMLDLFRWSRSRPTATNTTATPMKSEQLQMNAINEEKTTSSTVDTHR